MHCAFTLDHTLQINGKIVNLIDLLLSTSIKTERAMSHAIVLARSESLVGFIVSLYTTIIAHRENTPL